MTRPGVSSVRDFGFFAQNVGKEIVWRFEGDTKTYIGKVKNANFRTKAVRIENMGANYSIAIKNLDTIEVLGFTGV